MGDPISQIQSCITNAIDRRLLRNKRIAGIIGDFPSRYAKSPRLWNAVFRALKIKAVYLPFDVEESGLPSLVEALRRSDRVMGVNVTVPYKLKIVQYLDELDERARRIKAVNTVTRTPDGRLAGFNTDGEGFLESILSPLPGRDTPFLPSVAGADVLIIGAGGAARAVAFSLAGAIGKGQLLISNRTEEASSALAEDINKIFHNARAIKEEEIPKYAPEARLIVNCSIKGQGGIRRAGNGKVTVLEPYSALAPARPAVLPASEQGTPEFYQKWLRASLADVEANNRASLELAASIPVETSFYDLIYHPEETVFLRHGRLSGHRTLNGKGMIVAQAVEGFVKICADELKSVALPDGAARKLIAEIMWTAW